MSYCLHNQKQSKLVTLVTAAAEILGVGLKGTLDYHTH
jgi:hypothetical protein